MLELILVVMCNYSLNQSCLISKCVVYFPMTLALGLVSGVIIIVIYKQVRAHYCCINAETNVNTSLALSTAKAEIRRGRYDI